MFFNNFFLFFFFWYWPKHQYQLVQTNTSGTFWRSTGIGLTANTIYSSGTASIGTILTSFLVELTLIIKKKKNVKSNYIAFTH